MRRGSVGRVAPALLAVQLVLMFNYSGWEYEWDWALSNASFGLVLVGPLVAGLVAHDRACRMEPTLAFLAATGVRGRKAILAVAVGGALWMLAVWVLALAVAAVMVGKVASGWPDPWIFVESLALISVFPSVGLAVGTYMRNLWAGPLTAAATFIVGMFTPQLGVAGLLRVGEATGTLIASERVEMSAVPLIIAHLCLAGSALVAALAVAPWRWGVGWRRAVALAMCGVCVAASLVGVSATRDVEVYRPSGGESYCSTGEVTVCGPMKGAHVIEITQKSLSSAVIHLNGTGIDWQRQYLIRHHQEMPPDRGVVEVNLEELEEGRLPMWTVVAALVSPRLCLALFQEESAAPLLEDQETVGRWILENLRKGTPDPANAQVREAFDRLRECEPAIRVP